MSEVTEFDRLIMQAVKEHQKIIEQLLEQNKLIALKVERLEDELNHLRESVIPTLS